MQKVFFVRPSPLLRLELRVFAFLLLMNFLSIAADHYFKTHHRSYLIDTYLVKLFYFDGEKNIPAYFSTLNLFLCAGLSFLIYKVDATSYFKRWFYLALVFVFLAFDELISIHEALTGPMRALVQKVLGTQQIGVLYYAWIIPYLVFLGVAAVYFYKFVFSLPKRILFNLILSAIIFIAGAIGMEMVGGLVAQNFGMTSFAFQLSATVEESLEMLGIILFARTLVQYLNGQSAATEVALNFGAGKTDSSPLVQPYKTV